MEKAPECLIEGWMAQDELEWLGRMASTRKAIVEVGCWKGRSTKALAAATPGVVYAVDHWKGSSTRDETTIEVEKSGSEAIYRIFCDNLKGEIECGKVVSIRAESGKAARVLGRLLGSEGADMVFIDADHTYESVKRDIGLWKPLLRAGGLLSGHDYSSIWPGVVRAIKESLPGHSIGCRSIWQFEVS